MASMAIFLVLLTVFCISAARSQNAFVTVKCKAENVGLLGRQSMLECSLQSSVEVSNLTVRVLSWSRKGEKPVLVYNQGVWDVTPGYQLAASSWDQKNSNISLLITNTLVTDDGEYTYLVFTNSGDCEGNTSLKVKENQLRKLHHSDKEGSSLRNDEAEYSPPKVHSIPEKINRNEDSKLVCESGGGYPKGQLRWFDVDGQEWTASSTMQEKQTEDGLFQLSSELSLLRGSTYDMYTCVLFNASGLKVAEVTFELPPQPQLTTTGQLQNLMSLAHGQEGEMKSAAHIAAPLVVIGSLIVGLLLLLVLRRRRQSQLARRQSTRPLMDNHHEVPVQEGDVEKGDH